MTIERPQSKQPIPDHAQKVFTGVMFDVYQWEQEMYDGKTAIFEKIKRPDTVVVFPILEDGRIVLTKQEQPGKDPFVGAPGGRMDPGEDPITAAKRELREETGYESGELVLWKSLQVSSKLEWAIYVFIARGAIKASEIQLDAGEKIETMIVTFDEFLDVVRRDDYMDSEIYRDIAEALLDAEKMKALKKLLSAS